MIGLLAALAVVVLVQLAFQALGMAPVSSYVGSVAAGLGVLVALHVRRRRSKY